MQHVECAKTFGFQLADSIRAGGRSGRDQRPDTRPQPQPDTGSSKVLAKRVPSTHGCRPHTTLSRTSRTLCRKAHQAGRGTRSAPARPSSRYTVDRPKPTCLAAAVGDKPACTSFNAAASCRHRVADGRVACRAHAPLQSRPWCAPRSAVFLNARSHRIRGTPVRQRRSRC